MVRHNANITPMAHEYHANMMAKNKIKKKELVYPGLPYKFNGILFMCHNRLGRYRSEKECGDFF